MKTLHLDSQNLQLAQVLQFVFDRSNFDKVTLSPDVLERTSRAQRHFYNLIEKRLPIYGVTTGFGDSCFRFVEPKDAETLQRNLVSYLLCGSGELLPIEASRAMMVIRLKSLSRGYSGVSTELLERMQLYLENDWIPAVPREGSLGASGDLIPLAYLAQCLQGEGHLHMGDKIARTSDVLREHDVPPYRLKAKEGLALVNGTSAMAGLFTHNLVLAHYLFELAETASAWLCLALQGRTEPFDVLVNEKAGGHRG
jgi:histidine ammonia-lyase